MTIDFRYVDNLAFA